MDRHIVIVANTTWNIYNFRLNLIKRLLEENWRITVVAPLDEYISYREQFPNVKHITLKYLVRTNRNPFQDLRLIRELATIYKSEKPDLVLHYTHKPNIFGGFAARIAKVKSMAVITGLGYAFINKGIVNSLIKQLYKWANQYHSRIVFENDDDLSLFVNNSMVDGAKAEYVLGCGVDSAVYLPTANGVEKPNTIFTFIGRLLYDKGIVEFAQMAKKVKATHNDAVFWVIGDFDTENPSMIEKSDLLRWIDEGTVTYHGFQSDVRPLVAQSDCIVLPSYREGLPRVILEAMSMEKPIITTDTAGCRQTVDMGTNGFLVPVHDVDSLSEAAIQFMKLDSKERHQMGKAGRKLVKDKFDAYIIADQLYEIIDTLIEKSDVIH